MILNNAKDYKLGSVQVEAVYQGSRKVWSKIAIPTGYRLCEWLESDGNQHIDTRYRYDDYNHVHSITFAITGDYGAQSDTAFFGSYSTGAFEIGILYGKFRYNVGPAQDTIEKGKVYTRKNVGRYWNGYQNISNAQGVNSILFGRQYQGRVDKSAQCRIYEFTVENNGEKIVHMIPCLDANDRPCFYDTVRKMTRYNSGTGEFTYKLKE